MSVTWLAPMAFVGLALVIVPLLVHLLARRHSVRVLFPSLQFLPDAQLAALRRRVITDWPLMLVRMAVVAAAVAAAAAPVFISAARRSAWHDRVARAVVVAPGAAGRQGGQSGPLDQQVTALVEEEQGASFVSAVFRQAHVADGLRAAADWLQTQPPASRETVVVGDLREGALTATDLRVLPPHVGLRFLPVVVDRSPGVHDVRAVADVGGRAMPVRLAVEPTSARTRVEYHTDSGASLPRIRIMAGPAEQPFADALLRAVLRQGVTRAALDNREVIIAFEGATGFDATAVRPASQAYMRDVLERTPAARGGEINGSLFVRPTMPVSDARAPRLVAAIVQRAFEPAFDELEVRHIAADRLAQWSRPSTGSPADAMPADEHDRRWFWGAALVLLGVEQWLRRRPRSA